MASNDPEAGKELDAIRVLYLHGLELSPDKKKSRLIESAIGKNAVVAPDLKTRRTIIIFTLCYVLLLGLMIGGVVTAYVAKNFLSGILVSLAMIVVALALFFLAGRGVTQLMLRQAVSQAEIAFKRFKPNVIVASSFGAVAALQMDIPKLPMILLSPGQDQYYRYMHIRPYVSIGDYPYVIVVHGSLDKQVPLDDSIRLVETCELGRCRLEVVEADHTLSTLTDRDFKSWIEEAFEKGKEIVMRGSAEGNKSYDPSLFDYIPLDKSLKKEIEGDSGSETKKKNSKKSKDKKDKSPAESA